MTKKNLIITIALLAIIDLVAAGWYMSRRIESSGKSQSLFGQRDSTDVIEEADTAGGPGQADVFDKVQLKTYYFIANNPAVKGNNMTRYSSIKHVKVKWPMKVNGNDELDELNKELIKKAFNNTQASLKDARYVYMNKPNFNKPVGDEYRSLVEAPAIYPTYGNVSQVMVYPYMTSNRLLVMEVDKSEYNGNNTIESCSHVHYDRVGQRLLDRIDILRADKENKLVKLINDKIDFLNKGRGENSKLQHAFNVPSEICCSKKGIIFQFSQGDLSHSEPIEILVDYDKLEDFFTDSFKQLMQNNNGYWKYKKLDFEPMKLGNANKAAAVVSTAQPAVKAKKVKQVQTKRKKRSAVKRKSARRGRGYRRR